MKPIGTQGIRSHYDTIPPAPNRAREKRLAALDDDDERAVDFRCPRCDFPETRTPSGGTIACHSCGYEAEAP